MSYKDDIRKTTTFDLPWNKLSGCNILVTGTTGLIGSCLIEVLMSRENKDYHVFASGRNESRARERFKDFFSDETFHFFKYDVMEPLKGEVDFDYIIHAASNASPAFFAERPVEIIKSNILGVSNLVDYGITHGLKRLLYISTGEVYGEGDGRVFTEDYSGYVDCTKVRSCYPSSKRASETLCIAYSKEYNVDVVIARPSHTYGPNFTESDNRVYAQFIRNILKGEDIVMKSTGSQYRSWCYVVDCVSALLYILLKGENGQAYNIADNSSNITIKELAEMIAKIGNRKVVMNLPSDGEKAGYNVVTKSIFATDKIEELGWNIDGNMTEKMIKTINYCRKTCELGNIEC